MIVSKSQQEEFILRTLFQPQRYAKSSKDTSPNPYVEILPEFRYYPQEDKWYIAYTTDFVQKEFPEIHLKHLTLTPAEFRELLSLFGFSGTALIGEEDNDIGDPIDYPSGKTVGYLGTKYFKHKDPYDP